MQINYSESIKGLHNAINLLNRGAQRINREEVVEGLVDMTVAVRQAQANIAAIRTSDKMVEALLDIYG